jgi:hypothetical protein
LTEIFPEDWLSRLIEDGSNFEVLSADHEARSFPTYATDGVRVVKVRCQMMTSPFSGACLRDYKRQEIVK